MNDREPEEPPPRRSRWMIWVVIVFALQAGILFWVSRKSPFRAGPDTGMLVKTALDQKSLDALARENPELLAQPNPRGFSEIWLKTQPPPHQPHRWTPPDIQISYPSNLLTKPLEAALAARAPSRAAALIRPPPQPSELLGVPELKLSHTNRLEITGGLQHRPLAKPVALTNIWKHPDLLKPSIVQVVVNADGGVFTGALIGESGLDAADQLALNIALKKVRFQRLPKTTPRAAIATGDLVFYWHIDPHSVTNVTKSPR